MRKPMQVLARHVLKLIARKARVARQRLVRIRRNVTFKCHSHSMPTCRATVLSACRNPRRKLQNQKESPDFPRHFCQPTKALQQEGSSMEHRIEIATSSCCPEGLAWKVAMLASGDVPLERGIEPVAVSSVPTLAAV
jgi:hypothetical protein